MARPKVHDEVLRDALLEAAAERVAANGPDGFTLRDLAQQVGTSTTAVYSLFGSRVALLASVRRHCARSFQRAQESVPATDDPVADLLALAYSYRAWVREHPAQFRLVFGGVLGPVEEEDDTASGRVLATIVTETDEACAASIAPLEAAVERALSSGLFVADGPSVPVLALWGIVHGLSTIELGSERIDDESWQQVLKSAVRGWLAPGADDGAGG